MGLLLAGCSSLGTSGANGDISQVNGDVSDAAQVLSSLATGSCSNIGIPNTPSPAPTVSQAGSAAHQSD